MRNIQKHILREKENFVGLEDSKRTWRLCVRSEGVVVHQTCMPATYKALRNYFHNKFPKCKIHVIYEAGFRGFNLYDQLVADGRRCIVTPPHTVTEEKCQRKKNDQIDCRRLAKNLENNDYRTCFVPDKQLREDRQISRIYSQVQRDIVKTCNRIRRTLEFHGLDEYLPPGRWKRTIYRQLPERLKTMGLSAGRVGIAHRLILQMTSATQGGRCPPYNYNCTAPAAGALNTMRKDNQMKTCRLMLMCVLAIALSSQLLFAEEQCRENFAVEGSFFSGKTYKTWSIFENILVSKAYKQVYRYTVKDGWHITSADKNLGVISASQEVSYGQGKTVPLNIPLCQDRCRLQVTGFV